MTCPRRRTGATDDSPYSESKAPATTSRSTTGRATRARCQKSVRDAYGRPATIRATSASSIPFTSDSASRMP